MTLTFDLNIKIIFSPWIWVWQNVFALWHMHTKFWHIGVSPWDNMWCTFLTLVWPWPLTYMRVAGVSLVSFTHSFYLVIDLVFEIKIVHSFILNFEISNSILYTNLSTIIWLLIKTLKQAISFVCLFVFLFVRCLSSNWGIFHSHGDVTIVAQHF